MDKNELTGDYIREWINADKKLRDVINDIEGRGLSVEEQAEAAFHEISDMYGLPKMPEDIDEDEEVGEDGYEPSSVFVELGFIKYLNPDEDPRGNVLNAIYAVKNRLNVDTEEIFQKAYRETNNFAGFGLRGRNSQIEPFVVKKGDNWFDSGCVFFMKKHH